MAGVAEAEEVIFFSREEGLNLVEEAEGEYLIELGGVE